MHLVQYVAVAPQLLRGGPALLIAHQAHMQVAVDKTQLDPRMLELLANTGTAFLALLTPRANPLDTPWGRVHLPRLAISDASEMIPRVMPGGIVCPLPQHLITEDLARYLSALSGDILRFYNAPY